MEMLERKLSMRRSIHHSPVRLAATVLDIAMTRFVRQMEI